MDKARPKRGCNNIKKSQQNTIPSMIEATKTKTKTNTAVQRKPAEKRNLITVKTVSNSNNFDDTLSSDESFIVNRSKNFTPKRKSGAHSVLELNSSQEVGEIEWSNLGLVDDTGENILFQKYFHIVPGAEDEKQNVTAKCVTCAREKPAPVYCKGSKAATSNFVRHLKVICGIH